MIEAKTALSTTFETHATAWQQGRAPKPEYNIAIGYLRAFITLLVLAHHAALAYHPFAPAPPASLVAQPRWWMAFPIVDPQRWTGFSLFVGFNDIFFMSLMFFLSGLFVWNSLERKGAGTFLRDRVLRLGLPFAVAAGLVAPLAYYPSYVQMSADATFAGFWRQWLSLGMWPAGPAWFVWLLLAFDCVAAALFVVAPRWGETLGRLFSSAFRRPVAFFAVLGTISAATYIPMTLVFGPFRWTSFGPFTFQTSRLLHYAVYFFIAITIGAYGIGRGSFAPDDKLARRWPLWVFGALIMFAITSVVGVIALAGYQKAPYFWGTIGSFTFVLSCAASSLAFLAIFIRFARSRMRIFDSLRDSAYGMYLIHYLFVTWLQYTLLRTPLSAISKGLIVFLGTVALSWSAIALLRRIPAVARVI